MWFTMMMNKVVVAGRRQKHAPTPSLHYNKTADKQTITMPTKEVAMKRAYFDLAIQKPRRCGMALRPEVGDRSGTGEGFAC